MRKILLALAIITSFAAAGQTPFPLYIPSSPDSLKIPVNLNGATRTVYNIDLVKYRASLIAHDTATALRLLIPTNNSQLANGAGYIADTTPLHAQIATNITAIGLKADKSATISINGSSQTLGSNPSFTISGGGAASKKLWVNLADYADSTGSTDATTGINNAITATPNGGTLYIGKGYFRTSGGHVINKQINIIGSGSGYFDWHNPGNGIKFLKGSSIIALSSASATLFDYSGEGGTISGVDFRLDSSVTPTTAVGLNISAGSGLQLINNSFYQFDLGAHFVNGGEWAIDRCFFESNKSYGLTIENQRYTDEGDATISNSWFYAGNSSTGQSGINYLSGGGLKIVNTKFNGPLSMCINAAINSATSILMVTNSSLENFKDYGIKVAPQTGIAFNMPIITGCQFAPYRPITGNCIAIIASSGGIKNALISNNVFYDANSNTNFAILLNTVTGYEISGNQFSGWTNKYSALTSTGHVNRFKDWITVADAATIVVDADKSINQQAVISGSRAISFTNLVAGDHFTFWLSEDATGGWMPTFTSNTGSVQLVGTSRLNLKAGGLTTIEGTVGPSGFVTLIATPNDNSYTTTQRDALPTKVAGMVIRNTTNGMMEVYNGTTWDSYATPIFNGSPTSAYDTKTAFGNQSTGVIAANIYGIAVAKAGVDYAILGVNKNSVTGAVPSNSVFLSTYVPTGTIAIGRGNNAGTLNTADILVSSTGNVAIGGNGTSATSTLQTTSFATAYVAKTAAYTATATDYTIDCNGTFAVTLPTAVGVAGRIYVVKNSGAGTITLATTSAQTIDGTATQTISTQYGLLRVQSNGANWIVL